MFLYVKKECIGKKVYYRKIYITSNTESFKAYVHIYINDHISDNSVQINIKFTFTVFEYIIAYEYIFCYPV